MTGTTRVRGSAVVSEGGGIFEKWKMICFRKVYFWFLNFIV